MATYHQARTEHRQAAARCGLRLQRLQGSTNSVVLTEISTGRVVFQGDRLESWEWMRNVRGLKVGAH